MDDRYIISLNKSQEDVPVLTIFRENRMSMLTGGSPIILENVITGKRAEELFEELTNKNGKVVCRVVK